MTTISIAMSTYNGARFIREQLESLAAQTMLPVELVVTDDGSTDNTLEIVADFARTAPFAVHIHKNATRLGFRKNFMQCASFCAGDLIAFCDQDDIWLSHKLEKLSTHFEDSDVLLACHRVALVDTSGRNLGATLRKFDGDGKYDFRDLLPFAYSHGFTQVFRKDLLRFASYWKESVDCTDLAHEMAHDQYYFFLAALFGFIRYDDSILANYRQHSHNATGNIVIKSATASFKDKFSGRADEYDQIRMLAENRLKLLEFLSRDALVVSRFSNATNRLKQANSLYASFLKSAERRLELYQSNSAITKLRKFAECVVCGDYKLSLKNHWGFTVGGALRDMVDIVR